MNWFIGIDPGGSGGLAAIHLPSETASAVKMPSTDRDVLDWFERFEDDPHNAFAIIEKVSGYIGQGQPGSAMFKFGQSYGGLLMALTATRIPFQAVTPQAWQKGLGIPSRTKVESKTQWKNRLKAHAQRLFPKVKVTLDIADALLIAEYCTRNRT